MQRIPLTLAQPGMVLAKEIYRADTANGPPICGKGIQLSESLLERLRVMAIQSITVEGHPVWSAGDKTLEEQLAELENRFRRCGSDPLMLKLKTIYRDYLTRSMGE